MGKRPSRAEREPRGAEVGDLGVLVEAVGRIGSVCAEIQGSEAVAYVVVLVGVFVEHRVLHGVRQLAAGVVAVCVAA